MRINGSPMRYRTKRVRLFHTRVRMRHIKQFLNLCFFCKMFHASCSIESLFHHLQFALNYRWMRLQHPKRLIWYFQHQSLTRSICFPLRWDRGIVRTNGREKAPRKVRDIHLTRDKKLCSQIRDPITKNMGEPAYDDRMSGYGSSNFWPVTKRK